MSILSLIDDLKDAITETHEAIEARVTGNPHGFDHVEAKNSGRIVKAKRREKRAVMALGDALQIIEEILGEVVCAEIAAEAVAAVASRRGVGVMSGPNRADAEATHEWLAVKDMLPTDADLRYDPSPEDER